MLMPLALGVILFVLSECSCFFMTGYGWNVGYMERQSEQAFRKEQREEENIAGLIMDSTGSVDVRGRSVQVNGAGTGRFLAALPRTLFFLIGTENGGFCAGETPLWRTGCKSAEENGR